MRSSHLKRRFLTGTNATIVLVLVVATVALLVDLAGKHRFRLDLSDDAAVTLHVDTVDTLARLDEERVTLTLTGFTHQPRNADAFAKDRMLRDYLRELAFTSPHIEQSVVSFDADRTTAERLGVTKYGTLVIQALGDRVDLEERDLFRRGPNKETHFVGESVVTNAINKVLQGGNRVVYMLEGHRERRAGDAGGAGVGEIIKRLNAQGIDVRPLDLIRDAEGGVPAVPTQASLLLIVGPQDLLAPSEEEAITEYISAGGRVGLFLEPRGFIPDIVEELGVLVPSGIVHDTVAVFPHEDRPVLAYRRHEITAPLQTSKSATVVSGAAPLSTVAVEGVDISSLLSTSRRGWIERGSESPSVYDRDVDGAGPVDVALALELTGHNQVTDQGQSSRVLIVGDADILSDELLAEAPGNASFALNAVNWLMGDSRQSGGQRVSARFRRLTVSREQLQWVQWTVMGILPMVMVLGGALIHRSRRRR